MGYIGAGITRFNTADELTVTGTSEFGGNVSFGDNNITNVGSLQIDSIAGDADTNTNITFAGSDVITMTTAGTESVRIDSSQRVMLGTTTEGISDYGDTLTIADTDHCGMTIRSGTSSEGNVYFSDGTSGDAEYKGIVKYDHSSNALSFWSNSLRRATIDSSGNVLVGKTSADSNSVGIELHSNDIIKIARSGGSTGYFNRKTNDGSIIEFAKDGTTVGSIGSKGGDLTIGTGAIGVRFEDSTPAIVPFDTGTLGGSDNDIDLGKSSVRWNDLYLGGGVYLGGTGSSNHLDDYEEGTFTPVFLQGITTPGYATQTGTYIKIGRQVICSIFLRANSGTENNGHIYVGGLPFTITNDIDHNFGAFFTYNGGFFTGGDATSWLALRNQTNLAFYKQSNGGAIVGTDSNVAANLNADLRIVAIYRAD